MIDLDEVENLVSNFGASAGGAVAIELITRLRQAEKDAARYRELRDAESETCLEVINAKARAASPEWLDGLVDEYMKCSK